MTPDPEAVFSELGRLLRRVCDHPIPDLSADTLLEQIPGIDSLRLLQIVAHLEEHFDVEIEIGALDDLSRARDIVRAVLAARPAGASGAMT
jgi:acyl carrier protein